VGGRRLELHNSSDTNAARFPRARRGREIFDLASLEALASAARAE
jgi:hypothetical protein